jgi:hypothetical protein
MGRYSSYSSAALFADNSKVLKRKRLSTKRKAPPSGGKGRGFSSWQIGYQHLVVSLALGSLIRFVPIGSYGAPVASARESALTRTSTVLSTCLHSGFRTTKKLWGRGSEAGRSFAQRSHHTPALSYHVVGNIMRQEVLVFNDEHTTSF